MCDLIRLVSPRDSTPQHVKDKVMQYFLTVHVLAKLELSNQLEYCSCTAR